MKKGWQTNTLGDVCEFRGGGTPSKAIEHYWCGSIPWVSPKDMKFDVVSDSIDHITHEAIARSATSLIPKDSILIVVRSGILARTVPIAMTGRELAINQDLKALCPADSIRPLFLYYLLCSQMDSLLAMVSRGATVHRLTTEQLRSLGFLMPPLPEQERIVGILDKAFACIATAKANAEKNRQNAHAVFESRLQSVFTQRGPGWVEKSLGDVCEFENGDRGKNYPNRNEYVETGIPWINTGHIQPDGTLSMEEMNFITREKFDSLRSGKIQSGDLVYCLRGTLGKTALVDPLTEGAVASSLVILRPSSLLDGSFLYFFLTSPAGQGLINGFENGAAQPNLGAKSVAKYLISFPKIPEQRGIAGSLIELREETQRLARLYERKHAALEALKKSLLHQAFTGELQEKRHEQR
jgi:type I restriction enzyme S subunit